MGSDSVSLPNSILYNDPFAFWLLVFAFWLLVFAFWFLTWQLWGEGVRGHSCTACRISDYNDGPHPVDSFPIRGERYDMLNIITIKALVFYLQRSPIFHDWARGWGGIAVKLKGKNQKAKSKNQKAKTKRQKAKTKRQKAKTKRQKVKTKRQKVKTKRQKAKTFWLFDFGGPDGFLETRSWVQSKNKFCRI